MKRITAVLDDSFDNFIEICWQSMTLSVYTVSVWRILCYVWNRCYRNLWEHYSFHKNVSGDMVAFCFIITIYFKFGFIHSVFGPHWCGVGILIIHSFIKTDGEMTTPFYLYARISHECIPALVLDIYILSTDWHSHFSTVHGWLGLITCSLFSVWIK
jgi:hypothetical protein